MKNYNSTLEFTLGLFGVVIHSVIVIFILSYLAYPEMLLSMIDASQGEEKELLINFMTDTDSIEPIIYIGTAIIPFEWIALFKIRKYENKLTPVWSAYLILGSLYAYFYFGGLEVFILLLIPGTMTLYKYLKHNKLFS